MNHPLLFILPRPTTHRTSVWALVLIAVLWSGLPMRAQCGATYSDPIAITLPGGGFAMVSDTCDTQQWGGSPEAEQGMDIYYTLRLERFGYDAQDRLVTVEDGGGVSRTEYADNGNILSRTGQGAYHYDTARPHAVTGVDNEDGGIPASAVETAYNAMGKVERISDAASGYAMDIAYGPDQERWLSRLYRDSVLCRRTLYLGDVEVSDEYGGDGQLQCHTLYCYLGNGVIRTQRQAAGGSATARTLYAYTDNLGSIVALYDGGGSRVFAASYDAWGRQTVEYDEIGFRRGYTGHEMLPEFGLVNMNGRLYDSALGVFLSPDNHVQAPDNSQNYNRYSYCLNNPLKYTDPNGEFAWFIPVIAGAVVGTYAGASIQSGTFAFWHWKKDAWKGAITGGIIGATAGFEIASIVGKGMISEKVIGESVKLVMKKDVGIVGSILNGATSNIIKNAIVEGNMKNAWKSGIAGLSLSAWGITGGFGLMKFSAEADKMTNLFYKLAYQMTGTTIESVGDNWAMGMKPFSKIILGVGPINVTIGKGKLLQLGDNIGNVLMNSFGILNCMMGGKMQFDTDNLTFNYTGGLIDILYPPAEWSSGFSPYTITGNKNLRNAVGLYEHELHHLWHSRALNNLYLPSYALNGINALSLGGNFVKEYNYYEDYIERNGWW